MNILVTGGAGFIGANFLNLFVPRHPEHVFINVDKLTYAGNLLSLAPIVDARNYVFAQVDITDAEAVDVLFGRHAPRLVVHLAAESHVDRSILGPREFMRTNVEGTLNLLEACRRHWIDREGIFHHVSTDEVYGSLGETGAFTEHTGYDPSSPYSASKAASDHLVRAYARTYGLKIKLTNCSNNYGPYQFPEKLIPLMVLNALAGKPLPIYGNGLNVRDWLYVEDHCEAIWTVIETGRLGHGYNVGGDGEMCNTDVVHAICRVLAEHTGAPESRYRELCSYVPDRPGHDLRYAIDASKLRRECGWRPRESFESGLRKTVRWYLDNSAWVEQVRTGAYQSWLDRNYAQRNQQVSS